MPDLYETLNSTIVWDHFLISLPSFLALGSHYLKRKFCDTLKVYKPFQISYSKCT